MDIDPDRLRAILGALGGVAVYGCVQIGALGVVERGLLVRLACAAASAMILAGFLVRVALPLIPWPPLREAYLFGFVVGAFSWELLPIVFRAVRRRARERLERP